MNLKKKYKNNKGFLLIEAAVIFPIIIFSAVLVLFLAINYYVDLSYDIKIQESTNSFADKKTGNIKTEINKTPIDKYSNTIFNKKINVSATNDYARVSKKRNYILPEYFKIGFQEEDIARTYLIDEIK